MAINLFCASLRRERVGGEEEIPVAVGDGQQEIGEPV